MADNDFSILLQALLDEEISKGSINTGIDNIQNKIKSIKIKAELEPGVAGNIAEQINRAVNQKISINNIDINQGQIIKSVQQVGQTAANSFNQGLKQSMSLDKVIDKQVLSLMEQYGIHGKTTSNAFREIKAALIEYRQELQNTAGANKEFDNTFDLFADNSNGINKITSAIANNMKVANETKSVYKDLLACISELNTKGTKIYLPSSIKNEYGDSFNSMQKTLGSAFTTDTKYKGHLDFENFITELNSQLGNVIDMSHGAEAAFGDLVNKVCSARGGNYLSANDLFGMGYLNESDMVSKIDSCVNSINMAEQKLIQTSASAANTVVQNEEKKQQAIQESIKLHSELASFNEKYKETGIATVNENGIVDMKKSLEEVRNIYSDFGKVTIKNEMSDLVKGTEQFRVSIESSNGELKRTESFLMRLSEDGKSFVFADSMIKGSERVIRHLNEQNNATDKVILEEEKLANRMADVREKSEQIRQSEEKRQQLAQNNAINKAQEQEYKTRQKNIELAQRQTELDKKHALAFTEFASKKLSSAISKYSYGDSSEAVAMMKQMSRGLGNFGDLSNVQGNITQLSSAVDKIISDLKLSHNQALQALNAEIKAEQTLQSQKDSFNQKNLNAIDYEIQKREQEAKAFSSMLQAQMQEQQKLTNQVNKIQLSLDTGGYESKVETLISRTRQWTDEQGNARISTQALSKAFQDLNAAHDALAKNNTAANQQALINAEKDLDIQIKKITNSARTMNAQLAKDSTISSLHNQIQEFYDKNSAAHSKWGTRLKQMLAETASGAKLTHEEVQRLSTEFTNVGMAARQAGRLGKSFTQTLKEGMRSFSYWTSSTFLVMKTIQSIKKAVSTVKELDTALVDLKKTTTMTASQLEEFYYEANDVAKQMGVTTNEIITQASAWSRLGFQSAEAATKMAKYSSMFASISPGMDVDTATDGLVSVMKAFDIGNDNPDEVLDGIMSKINVIGNTAATSNAEIVNMLTKSSSAMREANNTLEQTIALETAAVEITRDDDSVGTAFKTVAMRIRGYDENVEDYTLDIEELSGKIADLTKTASTPGGISLFTDSAKTEYKSTYQLLKEISEIYDQLTDKEQAGLLEALAGKRQGQILAATINNFFAAEKAMKNMAGSAGSADKEMNVIVDSLDYKLNRLKETWGTGIAQNLFEREDMKSLLNFLTKLGEGFDALTSKIGLFGTIGVGAGVFGIRQIVKNFA